VYEKLSGAMRQGKGEGQGGRGGQASKEEDGDTMTTTPTATAAGVKQEKGAEGRGSRGKCTRSQRQH